MLNSLLKYRLAEVKLPSFRQPALGEVVFLDPKLFRGQLGSYDVNQHPQNTLKYFTL